MEAQSTKGENDHCGIRHSVDACGEDHRDERGSYEDRRQYRRSDPQWDPYQAGDSEALTAGSRHRIDVRRFQLRDVELEGELVLSIPARCEAGRRDGHRTGDGIP